MMPNAPTTKTVRINPDLIVGPTVSSGGASNNNNKSLLGNWTPNKRTLSEWSLNQTVGGDQMTPTKSPATVEPKPNWAHLNVEIFQKIKEEGHNLEEFIKLNMDKSGSLEINGWSCRRSIPSSIYEDILKPDLEIKRLMLRGRGKWTTCHCPKKTSPVGQQIDTITKENTTNLEHLYIMRTFTISACTLLDLIARSPKLKVLRFYGNLANEDHHEAFKSVRFLSDLERIYWPWCSKKQHLPALKTLVRRQDKIVTFYSNAETTCDLLSSDGLQNIRHLSLILNEDWECKPFNTKKASRYLKKINYLSQAKKLEALEIRSFDLKLDEVDGCQETNTTVKRLYENFQLSFWEQVAKLQNLKYLAAYGAWELDKVTRELARHGIQIEYFKTNLVPSAMMPFLDEEGSDIILSIQESIKNLGKLVKLRSLHYTCHDNLVGIDAPTVAALKERSDLIWVLNVRTVFTAEVEDLLTNILRRANTTSKGYKIKLHAESESGYANIYLETRSKYSSQSLRERFIALVNAAAKARFGKAAFKTFHFWGIEQEATPRDRAAFEQLRLTWMHYDEIFEPLEKYL